MTIVHIYLTCFRDVYRREDIILYSTQYLQVYSKQLNQFIRGNYRERALHQCIRYLSSFICPVTTNCEVIIEKRAVSVTTNYDVIIEKRAVSVTTNYYVIIVIGVVLVRSNYDVFGRVALHHYPRHDDMLLPLPLPSKGVGVL